MADSEQQQVRSWLLANRELLADLSYRERRILELRYDLLLEDAKSKYTTLYKGKQFPSPTAVGKCFHIPYTRVRQIENYALAKLRRLAEQRDRNARPIPDALMSQLKSVFAYDEHILGLLEDGELKRLSGLLSAPEHKFSLTADQILVLAKGESPSELPRLLDSAQKTVDQREAVQAFNDWYASDLQPAQSAVAA